MFYTVKILLIPILFFVVCSSQQLKKGYDMVTYKDLLPELIWMGTPYFQCLNAVDAHTLVAISAGGEVKVGKIKNGEFIIDKEIAISFNNPCKRYYTQTSSYFIWGYGVRDFQIIDLKSKSIKELIVSNNGNEMIFSAMPISSDKLSIKIDVARASFNKSAPKTTTYIYNTSTNNIEDTATGVEAIYFQHRFSQTYLN